MALSVILFYNRVKQMTGEIKVQTYNFGKRLKELRNQRSLTQSELEKLCGLPSMVLPHYENGTRKPGLDNILLICKGLKCSATDLLCI